MYKRQVFGRSSASGSAGRSDRRAEAYARPDAGKKAAAKMAFAAGDSVDHKTCLLYTSRCV